MTDVSRRTIAQGLAWTVPAIIVATAAPAAAASGTPAPVCVDPRGLVVEPVEGMPWKTNNGEGFTLVEGDAILVGNDGPFDPIKVLVTAWTSASQDGVRLVGASGDILLALPKSGNRATVEIEVAIGVDRLLQVVAPDKDASAHVIIGCSRGFVLKSAR
jgi:hypothetical protein